jgi:putative hydrolase of the HAD superfamily
MIKAVIFDFDGLILDTETAWFDSYREVLQEDYQFELKLNEFVRCVGADDTVLFDYLKENIPSTLDVDGIKERAKNLHTVKISTAKAREGVEQCLADAKEAGLQIALATSSKREWAVTHLTNLNLLSYFDYLLTQDDVEHVKPAPDLFLKALEVLGIQPEEGLVFEDSLNGLIAAKKAQLTTIIIPNPVTEALSFDNYHLKLSSMAEMRLSDILRTL